MARCGDSEADYQESHSHPDDSDSNNGLEDLSKIQDPHKLRQIIRSMQLESNTDERSARRHFGDATNTPDREGRPRTKRKNKQAHAARKRQRIDSEEPPPDARSDDKGDSDNTNLEPEREPEDEETRIKRVGPLYVLDFGFWPTGNARILEEKVDSKYDEKKRFGNGARKTQGQLRDIQKVLPAAYRGKKSASTRTWLSHLFMKGVSSQRPNSSSRNRRVAGDDIFACEKVDLSFSDVRLEKFREQIGWYVEEGTSGAYSSLDVSILHKDWSGEYGIATCFLTPCLMWLCAALVRGPSVATAMLLAQEKNVPVSSVVIAIPNNENMEQIFGIDHTESGALAGPAVWAIWALSADGDFRRHGNRTGIDYESLFDQYLEILTTGLREESRSILQVFKEWDRVLFPTSEWGHGRLK